MKSLKGEIWKDVKGYEGHYQVSNLGRVKSIKYGRERIMKFYKERDGYHILSLRKNGDRKTKQIHQLVAESFLNHTPNGNTMIVNHKNFKRDDNRLSNLEVITNRENTNKKHIKTASKFVGVTFKKATGKWQARIYINGESKYLGNFTEEEKAAKAYEKALSELKFNK